MFASVDLREACRWLVECLGKPLRFDATRLPALGRHSRLRVEPPITAPRAVLCTLWLVEDVDGGACLLAGHLRFVAHPKASGVRLAFDGRTAATAPPKETHAHADNAARQLLVQIAAAIKRPNDLGRAVAC